VTKRKKNIFLKTLEQILEYINILKLKKREYRIFVFVEEYLVSDKKSTIFFRIYKLKPMRLLIENQISIDSENKKIEFSVTDSYSRMEENIFLQELNTLKNNSEKYQTPFSSVDNYMVSINFSEINDDIIINILLLYEMFFEKIKKENLNKATIEDDILVEFKKNLPNYKLYKF